MQKTFTVLTILQLIIFGSIYSQEKDSSITAKIPQEKLDFYLLLAADSGNHSRVVELLKKGADVNADTYEGVSALTYAIQGGHYETVRALVANGADLEKSPPNKETPLMTAVINNEEDIVHYLLQKGASTKITNNYGNYPIHYAAAYGYYVTTDMLIFYKADLNVKNSEGYTPLMLAAYDGNYPVCELLVQKGANVNIKDNHNNTALMYACQEGHPEIAELLLTNQADVSVINNKGASALSLAIFNGHKNTAFRLIDKNMQDTVGSYTDIDPYKIAIIANQSEIADSLVIKGVKGKYKPFFNKLFLSYGFNLNPKDMMFETKFGINESKYKLAFDVGMANHYWAKRILIKESDLLYNQLWEKRNMIFIDIEKRFNLFTKLQNQNGFFLAARGLYTFGSYRGLETKIDDQIMIAPQIGFYTMNQWVAAKLNYEYLDFDNIGISTHRINLSFIVYFNLNKYQNINRNIYFY